MSGEVPEGWIDVRLKDVLQVRNGYAFSSKDFRDSGVPLIRQGNLAGDRVSLAKCVFLNDRFLKERSDFVLHRGDVLIGMSGSLGKLCVYDLKTPALQNQRTGKIVLHSAELTHKRFVFLFLQTLEAQLNEKGKGLGVANVSATDIESLPFRLAPLAEQRRIVEKVEALLEQVNRAKGRLERVPLILKRFRQAVLAAACSGELTREWRDANPQIPVVAPPNDVGDDEQENSDSFQPDLPRTWAWVALDDACEDVIDYRGRTPPISERGRIPHVRTTNVRRGKIDWKTESFVTEEVYAEYMTRGLPKLGDVIFTMEAPMGEAGVVDTVKKFSLAQRLLLLRGERGLLEGTFLAHMLQASPVRRAIEQRATGSTVLGIAYKRLKFLRLPVPPLGEQREIVRRVDELFGLSDLIERRLQSATARAEKLPQAILSKAFSGELVPTEAEVARAEGRGYETAEALLSRLRASGEHGNGTSSVRKRAARTPQKEETDA